MKFPIVELDSSSKDYPKLLTQIADPPKKLYCQGNIGLLNTFCFSIVGTRKITSYGKEVTENIVAGLAGTGWTIVSGLALGVDAAAHQAALDNNLPTIAVLGSTLNNIGPRTNIPLAEKILANGGLLISEYKSESEIHPYNFAVRDRITSGLSKGVLIVEGAEKSGSLITAKSAGEQNRDVFAVPGSIFSMVSRGTNELIKNGAKAVTSANDILEEYDKSPELRLAKNNNISTKDPIHIKILDILDEKGELLVDELIKISQLDASKVLAAVSILELNNQIKQRNGKYTI